MTLFGTMLLYWVVWDIRKGPVVKGECRGCGHDGDRVTRLGFCPECVRYLRGRLGVS